MLLLYDEKDVQEDGKYFMYGQASTSKANNRVCDGGLLMTTRSDTAKLTGLLLSIECHALSSRYFLSSWAVKMQDNVWTAGWLFRRLR